MNEDVTCFIDALVELQADDLFLAGRRGITFVYKHPNFKIPIDSHNRFVTARTLYELIDSCIPFRRTDIRSLWALSIHSLCKKRIKSSEFVRRFRVIMRCQDFHKDKMMHDLRRLKQLAEA